MLSTVLESGVYEPLSKNPTTKVERWVQKLLSKLKTALRTFLKYKLTPYHSRPSHLYGIPNTHKPNIPPRPTVSSIGSPCYGLIGFLNEILSPLAGKSKSFVKSSGHFVQLLESLNLPSLDTLVNFDVVNLFTNIPVDEVIRNKFHNDETLAERCRSCRWKPSRSCWRFVWEPQMFRWTISSSNRKMAWLWEVLYPSLETCTRGIWESRSRLGTTQTIAVTPVCWW
jgi:hypothetical protein